ncbi:hypothetical protein LOD99_16074 [Oopsacas minuta]|uniref:Uncharacterized protein n=1 Tax=Oopsacas minuta TaxID=111878 RepID=A0AAV7K925_9METZ|nr:hypothetical protein LOD99_16074 [Oopsacas minuta]
MSNSPRPNKVVRSNSNPKNPVPSVSTEPSTLTKHQSFINSPKSGRKLPQQIGRRDSKIPLTVLAPQDNTLIRYMDAELFRTVTGQNNLKLITKLDLSCPPNKPNSRKFPYIDQTEQLTNLVEINLSGNVLSRCDRLAKLTQLQKVYISYNKLDNLDGLWPLINLTVLDVSNNQIQRIPIYLAKKLTALRELYLAGNKLVSLPDVIKLRSLTGLVHLSIEDNPLSLLPHCRGMIVYGIPTLELLDGDPISEEEKMGAGAKYARDTLEIHETELTQLREKVINLEQDLDEALKGKDKLEKNETHYKNELQVKRDETIRLDDQLAVQLRLVDQKTNEMNHILRSKLELENQLAFYKLDFKVDHSRYTDLFQPNFAPDSENSDLEEIPYLGQARFMPSSTVHRTNHPDLSQPASYQAMPGVQYSRQGVIQPPDSGDPAHLARLVHMKEQGIQVSNRKEEDICNSIDKSDQSIQAGQMSPPTDDDTELLQRLAAVKEELRELKRRHQEHLDLTIDDSDSETTSIVRESVLDNASKQDLDKLAELIAQKELAMREIDHKLGRSVSVGEQVELMQHETAVLNEQLIRERAEREQLIADKAELVAKLNDVLNIETESVVVQTSTNELDELKEKLLEQEIEIQNLLGDQKALTQERNGLWRRLHKDTVEVGVSVRCHQIDQSTNTPRPRAKLAMSPGSRVDIPSGEQTWEKERQNLLDRMKQLEEDLNEKQLENQVLEDTINSIDLEKTRAIEERDQADEDRYQVRNALLDAETQLEALKREMAIATDALEGLDSLERDREVLERRLREEELDRQQVEGENTRLKDKVTQLKQAIAQLENARQNSSTKTDRLELAHRNMETQIRGYEHEIQELRDYITQMEQDRNRPKQSQSTQTPIGADYSSVVHQLRDLIDTVPAFGEPETVAEAIHQLPPPPIVQYPEERMVGELSDQLVSLFGHIGEELERLREQLVEIEAENADLKEIVNNTHRVNRTTQTVPDLRSAQLEDRLSHLQELLERAEHELDSLKKKRGVEVATQVKPRINHQNSQANILDMNLVRENEELSQRINDMKRDKEQLLDEIGQMDLGIKARDDQLHSQEEDIQLLLAENDQLKRDLHTVGVQTNPETMDNNLLGEHTDQGVSPQDPNSYHDMSGIRNGVPRFDDQLNHQDTFDNNSNLTESIEINGLTTRPPHRNVSLQADFFDTESRGMQTIGQGQGVQTYPFKDSSGTQTQGQGAYYQSHVSVDSPTISESSVFSRRDRPPNRTEIRLPDRDTVQVNSKSTTTRIPEGTGRRQEFRDIFIDEEIISSYSESEESVPPKPSTEKTTRVHYRTTRGAQTEKQKPKKSISRSDTELHDKIYISRKRQKHRVKKNCPKQPVNRPFTQRTVLVLSDTGSEESIHSVVEHEPDVNYVYLPSRGHKTVRHTHTSRPKHDYNIHVHKTHRVPVERHTNHYHTNTDNGEYFCNIPEHVAMEDEIDRLEALLGISDRRGRNTRVDISVRHNVLDRLSDIEQLLKEKVDKLGAKQEEQERLNHQLAREQQHLSRTAAELSRAGDELQQINVHLRGRSSRTDVITGQTSHGGMTPQLDTLQRRIENLTGILQGTEGYAGDDLNDLLPKKSRVQRELNKFQIELDNARFCLREVNEQKRNAQTEFYKYLDEKAELEDTIKRLRVNRKTEEANLKHLRSLLQELRANKDLSRSYLDPLRHQKGMDNDRAGKNEVEVLRARVSRYKDRIEDLEYALQKMEEVEQQNEAYLQEILELRNELNRIQGKHNSLNKHYNAKHTQTIDNLLENLQTQLSNLQNNISTELYNEEEDLHNQISHTHNSLPMEDTYPTVCPEVLPDITKMRIKNHQHVLDNINREHEVLMTYLQGNMQEGEKTVLTAQQETMQGVYDLKRQIEHLQTVLDEHKTVDPPQIPYDVEMKIKMQNERIEQMNNKIDKMSDKTNRTKHALSPHPPMNPFLSHPPSCPITSLDHNQGSYASYGYNSLVFDTPSKDNPDFLSQPNSISHRKSYDSTFDKNSPPTTLAPADSILFEDPNSDLSPPELRTTRSFERRQDYPSLSRPDTGNELSHHGDTSNSSRSIHSSHSTASILRHQMPDEHKLRLLEHRNAQELYARTNY